MLLEIFGDLMKSRKGRDDGKKGLERGDIERGISAEDLLLLVYNLPCQGGTVVVKGCRFATEVDLCLCLLLAYCTT